LGSAISRSPARQGIGLALDGASLNITSTSRPYPHEILVAQLLLAVPAVGTQEPVLGNAVVEASHVVGQEFGALGREPVVPDEHRLGGHRVGSGTGDH